MKRDFRRKVGFTLIELLVVLSIIALLVSLLLPALSSARNRARQITCAAQLKGITLGMLLYATDNKQWGFPRIQWGDNQALGGDTSWIGLYFPDEIMVDGNRVKPTFRCPDRDSRGDTSATYQFGRFTGGRLATTYFFHFGTGTRDWRDSNSYYGNVLYDQSTPQLHRINVPNLEFLNTTDAPSWVASGFKPIFIPGPSEQPAAQDTYSGVEDGTFQWRRNSLTDYFNNNHFMQGGHNVSYLDGHVKWLPDDQVVARHKDYYNRFFY